MSTKIGHFEILSELAKSPTGTVYKANDPESGQTIALKAIQLSAYGESAVALEKALLEEAEATKVLSSPNITTVYSASAIDGQFCAAMEYVQGNSIATMLARKEGFSIWDLLDIGRQLCSALDHASSHNLVHYSLEPAKIMCGWDGTVRILGFGVSSVGNFAQAVADGLPPTLHYMSPEQVQGLPMDGRSNLYSLGAVFYEMVTERRPFDADGIEAVRQSIVENTLVAPVHVNPKVHPLLSDLIMKALEKDPAQRYQNGREMLDDLEKCKESKPAAKKPEAAKPAAAAVPAGVKAAAQSKFVAAATPKPVAPPVAARPTPPPPPKPAAAAPVATTASVPSGLAKPASKLATPKAASVAVGSSAPVHSAPTISRPAEEIPELDLSNQFITASVKATLAAAEQPSNYTSSAVADAPEIETFEPAAESAPRIAVDPMMAEGAASEGSATSFSEISELPPLKEVYIAPPPPPPDVPASTKMTPGGTMFTGTVGQEKDEKPKVNAREAAEKAIKEIKGVPPRLALYALGGAAALILAIGIGVTYYIHQQNSDDDSGKAAAAAVNSAPEVSQTQQSAAPAPATAQDEPREIQDKSAPAERAAAPTPRARAPRKKAASVAPAIIPGQMAIDSTPAGAQVQIDGRSDPSWVTPFAVTNLEPGAHSITVSKAGYASDSRTVQVNSGNRATASIKLAQLAATLVVNSTPAGANVYVDGHDVGTKTPAQVNIGGGQHVVLVRKMGYLDETMNAQFILGQTFNFSPTLRPLGNVDDIRTVGKMSKIFGGKSALPGQSIVSIRTQPKGAQVSINQHIMDKNSPLDAALDPGNYVIDITMTGYAPVHKVINVDKGAKLVVDEMLQPQ
ncbi:MAG: serine/threonine-protein kinase [Candidatus Sulfotelmatobacter sp.]